MVNNQLFCILRSAKQKKIFLMYPWYYFSYKPNATKSSTVGLFLNIPGPLRNKQTKKLNN